MLAYHNNVAVKEKYVARMAAHIKADELIRGVGFNSNGKGCAVGCTLNDYNHSRYPEELGVPEWLAVLEDILFEGMSLEKSKTFPLLFLEAINVGSDLEKVKAPFFVYILEGVLDKFDHKQFPNVLKAIETVIELYKHGETDLRKFEAAEAAAEAAAAEAAAEAAAVWAAAAAAAVWAATEAAAEAAAEAARTAARTAVRAARTAVPAATEAAAAAAEAAAAAAVWAAAEAARTAARTAVRAAVWAPAVRAAAAAAAAAEYDRYADKLLELIKDCK